MYSNKTNLQKSFVLIIYLHKVNCKTTAVVVFNGTVTYKIGKTLILMNIFTSK